MTTASDALPSTADASQHALATLSRMVDEFRSLLDAMPAQMVSIFLAVAQRPGIYQRELPAIVGTSQASVSRNLAALSRCDRHYETGLNLIWRSVADDGERSPRVFLTEAGVALSSRLDNDALPCPPQRDLRAFAGLHWEYWVD